MNIQDLEYIIAIAESGSISKAAKDLFVAQPSLSKSVKKLEREFDITIFERAKGITVKLTEEGTLFLKMAHEILDVQDRFQERLRRLKSQKNTLILGLTYQRTVDLASDILSKFYLERPHQFFQVQTRSTQDLQKGVLDHSLDAAIISVVERRNEFHYELLKEAQFGVCLRTGSPAAQKAFHMDGIDFPVIRLEDLANEPFAINSTSSASRAIVDKILEKSNISLDVIEVMNNQSRIALADSGKASYFHPIGKDNIPDGSAERIFALPPEQSIPYEICLICLEEFKNSNEFRYLSSVLKKML